MKLVYWPIPGRAHVTRAILHYHEEPFEDVHQKSEDWPAQKEALKSKIPYPNLPYLVDGHLHLSESLAIAKYAARKCNCVLTDIKELAIQDQFEGFVADLGATFVKARYGTPEGEARDAAIEAWKAGLVEQMMPIEKHLEGKKWLTGDTLCWVDFALHSWFVKACDAVPEAKAKLANISRHTDQLLEKESYKKFYDETFNV